MRLHQLLLVVFKLGDHCVESHHVRGVADAEQLDGASLAGKGLDGVGKVALALDVVGPELPDGFDQQGESAGVEASVADPSRPSPSPAPSLAVSRGVVVIPAPAPAG